VSKTAGAIYQPPQEGFPLLAVVFMDERILACQPATTIEEGNAMIDSIMRDLPAIVDRANRDQDDEDASRS
jgi:hypothetical protein